MFLEHAYPALLTTIVVLVWIKSKFVLVWRQDIKAYSPQIHDKVWVMIRDDGGNVVHCLWYHDINKVNKVEKFENSLF